ncbi:MAG: tail fiber domain-containing protein [Crocinitomicaceae bacterium]|nr:tail fiber domain-containing protein [Crocinitomicaceae bacterium]
MKQTVLISLLSKNFRVAVFSAMAAVCNTSFAQTGVGINPNGSPADPSAGLDVNYNDKGLLIPRIALSATNSASPVMSPATSLLVYNTSTTGDVTPGYYYWTGFSWERLQTGTGGGSGGGAGVTLSPACTNFNDNYTIRGNGSGTWMCTDVLQVDDSFGGSVAINTSPSSSYDLRVGGSGANVGIGFSPNSSYELSVDGDGHFTDYVGIGTTPSSSYRLRVAGHGYFDDGVRVGTSTSPPTNGIISGGDVELYSSSSSFVVGSTDITGSGNSIISGGLSVGTTSSPPSSGLRTSGNIQTGGEYILASASSSGTALVRSSSGYIKVQSSTIKVKENIKDLKIDKEQLFKLHPVSFNLKPACGGDADIGLIAEEVEKVVPDLVVYGPKRSWVGDTGLFKIDAETGREIVDTTQQECYSVRYDKVGVYLVPIVAEQDRLIQQQQQEIAELKATVNKLISSLAATTPAVKELGLQTPPQIAEK